MDCDLQDPPEAIPMLLAKAREGHEAVFTTRGAPSYGLARRLGTAAYLRLRTLVSGAPLPRYSGFSLVSRRVVRAVVSTTDRHRTYLMSLRYLGRPRARLHHAVVQVPRNERHAGESSYTLRSLTRVALGNLSSRPRCSCAARSRPRQRGGLTGSSAPERPLYRRGHGGRPGAGLQAGASTIRAVPAR